MEREKVVSRETCKAIFEAADRLKITWPQDDDVTNAELETLLFPNKHKVESIYA